MPSHPGDSVEAMAKAIQRKPSMCQQTNTNKSIATTPLDKTPSLAPAPRQPVGDALSNAETSIPLFTSLNGLPSEQLRSPSPQEDTAMLLDQPISGWSGELRSPSPEEDDLMSFSPTQPLLRAHSSSTLPSDALNSPEDLMTFSPAGSTSSQETVKGPKSSQNIVAAPQITTSMPKDSASTTSSPVSLPILFPQDIMFEGMEDLLLRHLKYARIQLSSPILFYPDQLEIFTSVQQSLWRMLKNQVNEMYCSYCGDHAMEDSRHLTDEMTDMVKRLDSWISNLNVDKWKNEIKLTRIFDNFTWLKYQHFQMWLRSTCASGIPARINRPRPKHMMDLKMEDLLALDLGKVISFPDRILLT